MYIYIYIYIYIYREREREREREYNTLIVVLLCDHGGPTLCFKWDPGEEVLGSIPAVSARSLLVGSVSV